MKKFSIIMVLVAAMLTMFTIANAETPSAEPFPVATEGMKKSCCANKQKPKENKCEKKAKCDKEKCEKKEKCDTKEKCEKKEKCENKR